MAQPIVFVDSSDIREGKLAAVKAGIRELVAVVAENEPRTISYDAYFDRAGARMTVVQVHPDSASMEHHLNIAAPVFAKFRDLVRMRTMEIFGTPSPELLDQLRRKAEMLGGPSPVVYEREAGIGRFGAAI